MDISDEPPERSRAARRASKTRQRLMDAALAVINTHGFDGCSIENITELADVGKGTFYRHFREKSSILMDLLDTAMADLQGRMQAGLRQVTSLDTAAASILRSHSEWFAARPDLFILFLQAQHMATARPSVTPILAPYFTAYYSEIDKILSPYLPAGTSEVARHRLVSATSAVIVGFAVSSLSRQKGPQDVAENLEAVIQAFLAGVPRLIQ